MRGKLNMEIPSSVAVVDLCTILKELNFIRDFKVFKPGKQKFKCINLELFYEGGRPAVMGLKRVSKPGRRVYMGFRDMREILGGLGISIISTSRGLMTNLEARKRKLGGEVLCEVW